METSHWAQLLTVFVLGWLLADSKENWLLIVLFGFLLLAQNQ